MTLPFQLTRLHALIAGAVVVVLAITGVLVAHLTAAPPVPALHARLDAASPGHVALQQPVGVQFDHTVNLARATITLSPAHDFSLTRTSTELLIVPAKPWLASTAYTIHLGEVRNPRPNGSPLRRWTATFTTQPQVVASYRVGGKEVEKDAGLRLKAAIQVVFSAPMKAAATTITINDQPLPGDRLKWAPDATTVDVAPAGLEPYHAFKLGVGAGETATGDLLTGADPINLSPVATEPSNGASGITADFQTVPPIEVVLENTPESRPHSGLQSADIVYEYLSEYSASRLTAIYFRAPPAEIGPVRSCRMINTYLGYAFGGETLCSGASIGTLHYMFGNPQGDPMVPGSIEDFDKGAHFFRVNFRAKPHNLYTDGARAARLRDEWRLDNPTYQVDPPHDDLQAGTPADAPSVPLHAAGYTYDAGSRTYLSFDHGTPLTDAINGGDQVQVKTVVLLHVPFHDAGWIEDDNGGAHSVWYDVLGTGAADIYSDGRLVHATWHMGQGPNQPYGQNHQPVYFTDEAGNVMELNSGLTWVHILGNGQPG